MKTSQRKKVHREEQKRYYKEHPEKCKQASTKWNKSHREASRKASNKWQKAHPETYRAARYKNRHKEPIANKIARLEAQGWKCANRGCLQPIDLTTGKQDHDHKTGIKRGVLCSKCNSALGFLADSVECVKGLAAYAELFKHPAKNE